MNLTDIVEKADPNPAYIVDGICQETGDWSGDEDTVAPFAIFMPGVQDYLPGTFEDRTEAETVCRLLNESAKRPFAPKTSFDPFTLKSKIELDNRILLWLQNELTNGRFEPTNEDEEEVLRETSERLDAYMAELTMMATMTVLLETDDFVAFENPKQGDEGPIWIYDKEGINGLDEETPFYDVADPGEILTWLRDMRAALLD